LARVSGVDVGIASSATLPNGEEIENPRHLESALENLQRRQRRLSRKKKRSKRRAKQRIKVAKAHLKVSRCRKDIHHKASRDLVRRYDAITVEGSNKLGMVKNRRLARAISDVAWESFFTMTEGKAYTIVFFPEPTSPQKNSCLPLSPRLSFAPQLPPSSKHRQQKLASY